MAAAFNGKKRRGALALAAIMVVVTWGLVHASMPGSTDDVVPVIVRSEVTIDASPLAVWPRLVELQSWKPDIAAFEHVAGPRQAEGEVRVVLPANGNPKGSYFVETLRFVPGRHLVFRLSAKHDNLFTGFAAFTLSEARGRTHLVYDVYLDYRAQSLDAEQRRQARRQYEESIKAKLDAEHLRLKALVEQSATD